MRAPTLAPLALLTVAAVAAGPHVAKASADATTLRLTETVAELPARDLGQRGPGQGDSYAYRARLTDGRDRQIGTPGGEAWPWNRRTALPILCTAHSPTTWLAATFTAMGLYDMTARSDVLAVVGGTGRYLSATGEVACQAKTAAICALDFRLNR